MKYILSLLFCLVSILAIAQYDIEDAKKESEKESKKGINFFELKKRTYVGGEFSLSLGNYGTYIYVAPMIGFDINEIWSAGISGMYQFQRVPLYNGTMFNFSSYGGGVFTRLRPVEPLLIQAEFDLFNTLDFENNSISDRVNVPAFMAGMGYAGSLGDRSYYQIMLMYDFIDDDNMPLPSFITRGLHLKFGFVWYLE